MTVIDKRVEQFISAGAVRFSSDKEEVPVRILRDTASTQTMLVADECSLDKKNFTGRHAVIEDANGSCQPAPLYDIELKSQIVSGLVTVAVVDRLPVRGISLLLGNDLAGDRVLPSPVVNEVPVVNSVTENLKEEIPGVVPSDVTSAKTQQKQEKQNKEKNKENDDDEVILSDTFMSKLNESGDDDKSVETIYSQPVLIKDQEEADNLNKLRDRAASAEKTENVSQSTQSGVMMQKWCPTVRPADENRTSVQPSVEPPRYRQENVRIANDPVTGHLGVSPTVGRTMTHFHKPRLKRDVSEYCRSCHNRQAVEKMLHRVKPPPFIPIPVGKKPFSRERIDIVVPMPKPRLVGSTR